MRHALIADGIVTNVIEAPEDYMPPKGLKLIPHETANIGDRYDGVDIISSVSNMEKDDQLMRHAENTLHKMMGVALIFDVPQGGTVISVEMGLKRLWELRSARAAARPITYRPIPVEGGMRLVLVGLTPAEVDKLYLAACNFIEDAHAACHAVLKGVYSGKITTLEQVQDHPNWPSRRVKVKIANRDEPPK